MTEWIIVHNNPITGIDPEGLGALSFLFGPGWHWSGDEAEAFETSIGESMMATSEEWGGGLDVIGQEKGGAYDLLIDTMSDRYAQIMLNQGEGRMRLVALNDVTGFTPVGESWFNVDLATETQIAPEGEWNVDRAQRTLIGSGQLGLSLAGGVSTLSSAKAGYTSTGIQRLDAYLRLRVADPSAGGVVRLIAPVISKSPNQIIKVCIAPKQLTAKFMKHAKDFGITGNYNTANSVVFEAAIQAHVNNPGTIIIRGSYRGQPALIYLNPKTGLVVVTDRLNNFVSGWKTSAGQLQNVLRRGKLGGG